MLLTCKKAQSTLEYALLIAVVAAGLVGMQHYVRRSFQGNIKGAADSMGDQFAPGAYSSEWTTTTNSTRKDLVGKDETGTPVPGVTVSKITGAETTTRSGWDKVTADTGAYAQ